jgi:DNA-binding GntR family transcriptional regulator
MDLRPIQTTTIQEKVYEELLQGILSGRIPPGQQITIEGIASLMEVSLMPVRVALQKLEASGFVSVSKNRRYSINRLNWEELSEITEIRLILECHAAENACLRRSEEALDELAILYEKCIKAPNADSYIVANRDFHAMIYREAKMPILEDVIRTMWHRVSPYLHMLLRRDRQWKSEDFAHNHHGMVEALRNQDPNSMRHWLTKDLTTAAERIKHYLEKIMDEKRE